MANKLPGNLILNLDKIGKKCFRNDEEGNYMTANRWDLSNFNVWISSNASSNQVLNNDSIKPILSFKFGTSLYEAYQSSVQDFVFENTNWDGTSLNTINANGTSYFYWSSNSPAIIGTGYLMESGTSNVSYYRIENGKVVGSGYFTPVNYESIWYYSNGEPYINLPDEVFDNSSGTNEKQIYLYQNKWYSTWTYETPSANHLVNQTLVQYINDNLYYYKIIIGGYVNSEGYAYYVTPQISSITFSSDPVSSSGGDKTVYITITAGTYWYAYVNNGSDYARITDASADQLRIGSGTCTLNFNSNSGMERSANVIVSVMYPNKSDGSGDDYVNTVSSNISQSGSIQTQIMRYIYYDINSPKQVEMRSSLQSSTTVGSPGWVSINITVTDHALGEQSGTAIFSTGDRKATIEWDDKFAISQITYVKCNDIDPDYVLDGTTQYIFQFATNL